MSQPQNQKGNQNSQQPNKIPELDVEVIKAIVQQQSQKLQIEAARLKIEEKRLEQDGKLSEESLRLNGVLLQNAPKEHRKTTQLYIIGVGIFLLILLGFISICLYFDKEDFLLKFLEWISHFAALVIGFFVGRISKKVSKQSDATTTDAEVVESIPE